MRHHDELSQQLDLTPEQQKKLSAMKLQKNERQTWAY